MQGGDAALMTAVTAMSLLGPMLRPSSSSSLTSLQKSLANSITNIDAGFGNSSSLGGIENVDYNILNYDLDCDETFFCLDNL